MRETLSCLQLNFLVHQQLPILNPRPAHDTLIMAPMPCQNSTSSCPNQITRQQLYYTSLINFVGAQPASSVAPFSSSVNARGRSFKVISIHIHNTHFIGLMVLHTI